MCQEVWRPHALIWFQPNVQFGVTSAICYSFGATIPINFHWVWRALFWFHVVWQALLFNIHWVWWALMQVDISCCRLQIRWHRFLFQLSSSLYIYFSLSTLLLVNFTHTPTRFLFGSPHNRLASAAAYFLLRRYAAAPIYKSADADWLSLSPFGTRAQ